MNAIFLGDRAEDFVLFMQSANAVGLFESLSRLRETNTKVQLQLCKAKPQLDLAL